ncbi:RSP_7527 family protein [Kiloniella majae]|uniref:RSP_7527 family protein n=1 Tax=Kiloniella majae TaxID=1938558 RepID=UPI0013021F09|nr:hypothetical protein [Kiloniella majae]
MKPIVTAKDFDFTAADIDFHVREAHRLRSEAAGRLLTAMFKSIKDFLSSMSYHKMKHA